MTLQKPPSDREVLERARRMKDEGMPKGSISAEIIKMFNGNITNEKLLTFWDMLWPEQKPKEQKR